MGAIGDKRGIEAMFITNFPKCKIVHLSTYPKMWRHCCGPGGLQIMSPLQYKYYAITVHYIYCGYCNQITYIVKEG